MFVRLLTGTALLLALSVSAQCMDKDDLLGGLSDLDLPPGFWAFEYETGLETLHCGNDLTITLFEPNPSEAKSDTSSESPSPVMGDLLGVEDSPKSFHTWQDAFLSSLEPSDTSLWEDRGSSREDMDFPLDAFGISLSNEVDGFGEPLLYRTPILEISALYWTLPDAEPLNGVPVEQPSEVPKDPINEEPSPVVEPILKKKKIPVRKRKLTMNKVPKRQKKE